jgi:ribonuclease BN (tRNA processing enzyme)
MKITFLGTGTSLIDPDRVQSGLIIEGNGEPILFDIGSGILRRLVEARIDITTIAHVFLSHFHVDHCSDFLPLCQSLWLENYQKTLMLYGPPSMKEWSRGVYDVAFPYLRDRISIEQRILEENDAVYIDDVTITTSPTTHGSYDSRAFKIEHEGKSAVYSADTAPSRDVIELASGVDVLIHECNWLDGNHKSGVHTSPSELMGIVEEAQPKKVVLTHLSPEVVEHRDEVISIVGRRTNAEILLAEDLMILAV